MFRFRLQRVLELREKKEQARARELSHAETEADAARQKRDALAEIRSTSRSELSAAQQSDPKVGHLHHMGFVLDALDQRLNQAAQVVNTAEGVVSDARTSLEDALRDRRVLDRLKERHADVHRLDEAHRDRLHMDEIALSRFARSRDAEPTHDNSASARPSAKSVATDGGADRPTSTDETTAV